MNLLAFQHQGLAAQTYQMELSHPAVPEPECPFGVFVCQCCRFL